MKQFAYLTALVIIILLVSCDPGIDSFDEDQVRVGRVYFKNSYLTPGIKTELPNSRVYLGEDQNANNTNYLYSQISDQKGYFEFANLKQAADYSIFSDTVIDGVLYTGRRNFSTEGEHNSSISNPVELLLEVDTYNQNGLFLETLDTAGNAISKCNLCFYTSLVQLDSFDNCNNAVMTAQTDNQGRKLMTNIPPGTYYIKGYIETAAQQLWIDTLEELSIPETGIVDTNLIIKD